MEQDLGAKAPDPARARVNADATAGIPSDAPPAEKEPAKAEVEKWDRPAELARPAGNRDPEDRVETDNQNASWISKRHLRDSGNGSGRTLTPVCAFFRKAGSGASACPITGSHIVNGVAAPLLLRDRLFEEARLRETERRFSSSTWTTVKRITSSLFSGGRH